MVENNSARNQEENLHRNQVELEQEDTTQQFVAEELDEYNGPINRETIIPNEV